MMRKCYCCGRQNVQDHVELCPKCGKPMKITAELIERARANNQDAYTELYQRTCQATYGRILFVVSDQEVAETLTQDVYARAFSRLNQLKTAEAFPGWLETIAHNMTVNWMRAHEKDRQTLQFSQLESQGEASDFSPEESLELAEVRTDFLPEDDLDRSEVNRLLLEIISSIPDIYREPLMYRFYGNMSLNEISEQMGLNPTTTRTRIQKGKKLVEKKVLELEKKGTKLYGLSPLPFLLFLLRKLEFTAPAVTTAEAEAAVVSIQAKMQLSYGVQAAAQQAGQSSGIAADAGTGIGQSVTGAGGFTEGAVGASVKAGGGVIAKLGVAKVGAIALAAVLVGGAASMLAGYGGSGKTIDLNQYLEISASGYDGSGTASYRFDSDALEADYGEKLELKTSKMSEEDQAVYAFLSVLYGENAELKLFLDLIDGELDVATGLSNGDTVTWVWNCEEDLLAYYNYSVSFSDVTYTVSGLDEPEEYDVFQYVTVEFSGTSPNASASLSVSGDLEAAGFSLDASSGLAIGDVVTVTVADNYIEKLAEQGKKVVSTSATYEVSGVSYYASSMADIPDDALEKMQAQAQDVFSAYVAKYWETSQREYTDFEYIGNYFLQIKDATLSYKDKNVIYLVYRVDVTQYGYESDGTANHTEFSYYWFISFTDGMFLSDGTYTMDYSSYSVPIDWGSSWFLVYTYNKSGLFSQTYYCGYVGYQDLDLLFYNEVTANEEYYTYENNVSG